MENTSDASSNQNDAPTPEFPSEGALLGIDFGTKRLGFAVCDRAQTIASPVENYQRQSEQVRSPCLAETGRRLPYQRACCRLSRPYER